MSDEYFEDGSVALTDALKPAERRYYRHRNTGDRAYVVVKDGLTKLHRDRPGDEILVDLTAEWLLNQDTKPLTRIQLAKVAFVADRELCRAIGMHKLAAMQWANLSERARIRWMEQGPIANYLRIRLFKAIMSELSSESA